MVVPLGIDLEPNIHMMSLGEKVHVLAEILIYCPGSHICRTAIKRQIFRTDIQIDRSTSSFTILDAQLGKHNEDIWMLQTSETKLIQHKQTDKNALQKVIEACAGIGAVGQGFKQCGAHTVAYCDSNEKYCQWLRAKTQSTVPVIHGNICSTDVIKQISDAADGPAIVSAGVSCQPFSGLGDRLENQDQRSESVPGALKLGYFTRAPILILECTKEALDSLFMQSQLRSFCSQTGYVLHQANLDLHKTWPSSRTRWWAILSLPFLGVGSIPQMPELSFAPCIVHLMQLQAQLDASAMNELSLDSYELRHYYHKPGGIYSSLVNSAKKMPVATHSWGTQLGPCHCGCRKGGFSAERLQSKGLYGLLIPLNTTERVGYDHLQGMRYPHPCEVSIFNGLMPEYLTIPDKTGPQFSLKFLLSGVGQLASPLQGAWVLGNVFSQIANHGIPVPNIDPSSLISEMGLKLIQSRFEQWPNQITNVYTDLFVHELIRLHSEPEQVLTKVDIDRNQILTAHKESFDTQVHGPIDTDDGRDNEKTGHDESRTGQKLHSALTAQMNASVGSLKRPIAVEECQADVASNTAAVFQAHTGPATIGPAAIEPDDTSPATILDSEHAQSVGMLDEVTSPERQTCLSIPKSWKYDLPEDNRESKKIKLSTTNVDGMEVYGPNGGLLSFAAAVNSTEPTIQEHAEDSTVISTEEALPAFTADPHDLSTQDVLQDITTSTGIVWIGHKDQPLRPVKFAGSPTVGQLSVAETNLQSVGNTVKAMTPVGSDLSISQVLTGQQIVLLRDGNTHQACKCPIRSHDKCPPKVHHLTRSNALWHQQGWVAQDEMGFYIHNIETDTSTTITDPIIFADLPTDPITLGNWLLQNVEAAGASNSDHVGMTACWFRNHWFPIKVTIRFHDNQIDVKTTPNELSFVQVMMCSAFGETTFNYQTQVGVEMFQADCGFQVVAWLTTEVTGNRIQPIDVSTATNMRIKFDEHLNAVGHSDLDCRHLLLGGMPDVCKVPELAKLLEQHGVSSKRSTQLTNHVTSVLGVTIINQVLQAPNPWKDLKMRCNVCKPPIQLVLSEELQAQIDARVKSGKQFGKKQGKVKRHPGAVVQQRSPIQLRADQVQIPPGIFQQHDGKPLHQINIDDVKTKQRGVAVMSMQDAMPFFDIKEALTAEGLGLLVINYKADQLPAMHVVTSFPAHCSETSEPMIIKAALVQLGQQAVNRTLPSNMTSVQEVETQVLRCMIYRDQSQMDWSALATKPVKTLLQHEAFTAVETQGILDIWDRQFLTKTYQKARADQAELFSVTMRLVKQQACQLIDANARGGLYFEPRTSNGRSPCPDKRIVWLPKKGYQEVLIAKQQTAVSTEIARSGDRYGLRTAATEVEKVHSQHRPDVEYLDSTTMRQFKICPLPYGTTKTSLQQVFTSWQWKARPSHPQGQNPERTGLAWIAYATENPKNWIFTMTHGDVLVSEITSVKTPENRNLDNSIVASQRTLRHLCKPGQAEVTGDPWLTNDPWKSGSTSSTSISQQQIARIEASVEKKIMTAIQGNPAMVPIKPDDETMDAVYDDRISALEFKVNQMQENMQAMSTNMNSFQQSQTAHNQQVAQQIQATQHQLEQHNARVENMLDRKLESQMSKIEALLEKRGRHHE